MDKKPPSSRIRSFAISAAFFLFGAYSPAVSLWWGLAEPALYATPELTSWAMFLFIFGYIFAIVLGGILGLGILHLIRIGQQKALQRWPRLQKPKQDLSPKQKLAKRSGFVLVGILALGVIGFSLLFQLFIWVAVPGASVRIDKRPSPAAGVYTIWSGQMLVVVPSKGFSDYIFINPMGTREDAPAMCDQGYPREAILLRTHLIQVETNDFDDAMACESMPGVEVLIDPDLRLQPFKMTFTSPDNQHVEITFWHI